MRALAAVLVATFVVALSGAAPVSAQENTTPGLWINPELGLATPADAAERYKAPFHTWLVDEEYYRFPKNPDWREQIFYRFVRPSANKRKPPFSRKVTSCAAMLAAWQAGYKPSARTEEPHSLLSGTWTFADLMDCRVLKHLARLRPIETPPPAHPDFLARVWTVRHLSPLAYAGFSIESVCNGYSSEVWNGPHLALQNREATHGGGRVFKGMIHQRHWDAAMSDGDRVWAVWAQAPAVEVAGITVSPRIRLESEESNYSFTVRGIGSLPGHGRPVLVVSVRNSAKNGGTMPTTYETLVLAYDAEIEIFRVINLEDFEHYFRHYDCVPPKRK